VTSPDDGTLADLLKITEFAEKIGALDQREGEHFRDVSHALSQLRTTVNGIQGTIADQADILAGLNGLDDAVAKLTEQITHLQPPAAPAARRYQPSDTVRWWDLQDNDNTDKKKAAKSAIARLRNWVEHIYRPHYGYLAAALGDCWEQHPLCLMLLDWLSELWSVLHLNTPRTERDLGAQSEFATRILPAAAEQLHLETSRCGHKTAAVTADGAYAGGSR
jgi:hypothetical protein